MSPLILSYSTMGCGSSTPQQTTSSPSAGPAHSSSGGGVSGGGGDQNSAYASGGVGAAASVPKAAKAAVLESRQIDSELERARNEDIHKIKMLLLGAGESGKSTIFKQMRLLYGNANRSDEDLKMYGVVARSNIVVAMRKLVSHLRDLGLEEELDRESKDRNPDGEGGGAGSMMMTCREAYDELVAYLVDNSGTASAQDPSSTTNGSGGGLGGGGVARENGGKIDWVGNSPRAGLAANNDAKLFLAHYKAMEVLWKVRR